MFPELFRDDVFRLETRRLWLRWPAAQDEAAIARYAGDPAVAEMTAEIPHPYPPGAAGALVYQARAANAQGSALTFALALRTKPQEAIGMISLRAGTDGAELGYWLGPPFQGKGLMHEAAAMMIKTVFKLTGIGDLQAHALVGNAASRGVIEACGFVQTGEADMAFPARGGNFRCAIYRLARAGRAPRCGSTSGSHKIDEAIDERVS